MDGHSLSLNAVLLKKFDGLNFDGLAGSIKNVNISPRQNFPLYGSWSLAISYQFHYYVEQLQYGWAQWMQCVENYILAVNGL